MKMIDFDDIDNMAMKMIALGFAIHPEDMELQLQNERNLISLCCISNLSRNEVIEIMASLPYSLESIYRYYLANGKFPE